MGFEPQTIRFPARYDDLWAMATSTASFQILYILKFYRLLTYPFLNCGSYHPGKTLQSWSNIPLFQVLQISNHIEHDPYFMGLRSGSTPQRKI